MKAYRLYLVRVEKDSLYKEATADLLHLLPPQFRMEPHASLTEDQALSLLELTTQALCEERRVKINLLTCEKAGELLPTNLLEEPPVSGNGEQP